MSQKVIGGAPALTAATQLRYANAFGKNVVAAGEPLMRMGNTGGLLPSGRRRGGCVINALLLRDAIMLLVVLVLVSARRRTRAHHRAADRKIGGRHARVTQGKFNEG